MRNVLSILVALVVLSIAPAGAHALSKKLPPPEPWSWRDMRSAAPLMPMRPDRPPNSFRDLAAPRTNTASTSHTAVADPTLRAISGRLFFEEGRYQGSCSATAINTESMSLAVTAAHCLWMGRWAENVVFVPGYQNGESPHGQFYATALLVTNEWARSLKRRRNVVNYNYDFGFVALAPGPDGRRLVETVGGAGLAINLGRKRKVKAVGYPGAAMQAEWQRMCSSWSGLRPDYLSRSLPGPKTMRIRCDMAKGSSGGGWFTWLAADGEGPGGYYLNGITSYSLVRGYLSSPYFGRLAWNLVKTADREAMSL